MRSTLRHVGPFITIALILLGVALRGLGANHPLWLDEIWSCEIAAKLTSPLGVLTQSAALVDNNHPLNTCWLALLGKHQPFWMYHVPSLLAGVGTLALIAIAAARRSMAAAVWSTALAAVSLPLIQFSFEARGYALAAFFGVAMFDAVERFLAARRWLFAGFFLLCCVLGGLSHLLILHVYVGLAAVSALALWRERKRVRPLQAFAMLHVGPLLFWLIYYALFVGRLKFGGGAPRSYLFQSVCDSLAGLCGWVGPASFLFAGVLIIALIALAIDLARRENPLWVFIAIGCFLSPIVLVAPQWILSASPVPMASRYFLPLVPIVIVLCGDPIARRPWLQVAAVGVVLLNLVNSVRVIVIAPGDGSLPVQWVSDHGEPPLGVLADHPLRTKMVLDFYAGRLHGGQPVKIYDLVEHLDADAAQSRWLVVHARGQDAPRAIDIGSGKPFERVWQYPAFGLSGYDFTLYKRSD